MKKVILIALIGLLLVLLAQAQTTPRLVVTWDAIPDSRVASYVVMRGLSYGTPSTIATVTTTQYQDDTVDASTSYNYVIAGKDNSGVVGLSSAVATGNFGWFQPAAPTSLTCQSVRVQNKSDVTCSWTGVTTSRLGSKPLSVTYIIYRTGPGSGGTVVHFTSTTPTFSDKGLPRNKTFWYGVTAVTDTMVESLGSVSYRIQT